MEKVLNEKIEYWVEIARYDLETAEAMLKTKRYLYVGFMCHQAIEKILKAVYVLKFNGETPPYTHNLLKLSAVAELYNMMTQEQKDLIDTLSPLNIEARYPSVKKYLYSSLNNDRCICFINQTKELLKWIEQQLLK